MTDNISPLVSGDWLAARLGEPDLLVFDASFYLPTEPRDAHALFAEAHIPGAAFFDLEELADQDTDLPHMAPTAGRFARLASALGISNRSTVVFYDQKGLFSSARGWWLMRLFGHDRAAVLDGGLPKWLADGRPVSHGPAPRPTPGDFAPDLRASRLRGLGDMRAIVAGGTAVVLDARPAGRFTGEAPEPRPGLPGGHMPGASSVPAGALLAPDQTMHPPEVLRAIFAAAGVDGARPVVTTCGTGVTAAVVTLGLATAGLDEGALYDGSWTEWAGRADTPKQTGPA